MVLVAKGNREDAIHALMNQWLKSDTRWCLTCNSQFYVEEFPCCDRPFITTNINVFKHFQKVMTEIRDTRKNKFASTDGKTLRYLLKFPPGLYEFLDAAMKRLYNGERLFTKEHDEVWFAKHFGKHFQVPKEI